MAITISLTQPCWIGIISGGHLFMFYQFYICNRWILIATMVWIIHIQQGVDWVGLAGCHDWCVSCGPKNKMIGLTKINQLHGLIDESLGLDLERWSDGDLSGLKRFECCDFLLEEIEIAAHIQGEGAKNRSNREFQATSFRGWTIVFDADGWHQSNRRVIVGDGVLLWISLMDFTSSFWFELFHGWKSTVPILFFLYSMSEIVLLLIDWFACCFRFVTMDGCHVFYWWSQMCFNGKNYDFWRVWGIWGWLLKFW